MRLTDLNLDPSARHLRQFAAACWLVLGGLAGWRIAAGGPTSLNLGVLSVASAIGIVGLFAPRVVRPLYQLAMVATFPIGWLISNLLLMAIFYLLITPLAVWFRAIGRDELRRRKPDTSSYWIPRQAASEPRRYLRQY